MFPASLQKSKGKESAPPCSTAELAPISNSYLPWVGRGRKHDQHGLWWEDKGFLFLFPLPLNRLLTLQRYFSPLLGHCIRAWGAEQRTSQEEKEKGNEMPELMWTLGLLLSFYPISNNAPLSCCLHHIGILVLNSICTFSLEAIILGRPCYWKMAGLRPALLQKAELKAWVLGACTAPMKLHGSKYRASRQGYSPGWLHFSREPLVSSIIW